MIYTFYGRVSTDSDSQVSALDNQEQYWLDYFQKYDLKMNINCGVYYSREGKIMPKRGFYIDEGISGYKSKKYRKAFLTMINDAKLKKFDMIYTRSISRFGRNVEDIVTTINLLKRFNVGVYFEDIKANTLDKNDDFKIHIFMGLAQEESRLKSSSVQKGKIVSAKNEVWSGSAPYGYDIFSGEMEIDGVVRFVKGRLIVNQDEAVIVRRIFNLYLIDGWGLSKIAKYLNEQNTPRKRKSSKWDQSIISKMLKNPIYKGIYWLHRTYNKDPQLNIIAEVAKEDQIIKHISALQIIEDDIFEKVQLMKEERAKMFGDFKYKTIDTTDEFGNEFKKKVRIGIENKMGRYSGAHLFSNLLKCGNCGSPLRFKKQKSTSGKVHNYWFCSNNDNTGQCKYRNLQRNEEIIDWVKKEIEDFISNDTELKSALQKMMDLKFDSVEIEHKIIKLNEEQFDLKQQADTNLLVLSKGYIREEEFKERAERLDLRLKEVNNELDRLKNVEREKNIVLNQFDDFVTTIKKIDTEKLDNHTLRAIIERIVFTTNDPDLYAGASLGLVDLAEPKVIHWKFMDESLSDILDKYTDKHFKFYVGDDEYIDPWTLLPIK